MVESDIQSEPKSLKRKHEDDKASYRRTPSACLPCRRRKVKCNGAKPYCENCLRLRDKCQYADGEVVVVPETKTTSLDALLNLDQRRVLLDIFFATPHLDIVRQSIHRPTFETATTTHNRCPFLLVSIFCLSALYISGSQVRDLFNGETAADLSERLAVVAQQLSRDTSDLPSVPSTQANLILGFRELLCRTGYKSWMYTGVAIRMTQALRLGREYHQRHSPREQEIRRRTMWTCFIMDRLVSHVTARPHTLRTIKINIQLPCSETAFLFEENSSGTVSTLDTGPSPDCTEVLPFFIKAVAFWGTMTDLFANGVRGSTSNSPTDPNGAFYKAEREIKEWKDNLPGRMQWSMKNYRTHRVLGQASLFVSLHFVLNHALCVAHQEYLPQLDGDSIHPIMPDATKPAICNVVVSCIHHADEITRIASSLYGGDAVDKEMLCAPFAGTALECAACCHLWSIYLHEQVSDIDPLLAQPRATPRQKLRLLGDILKSWSTAWPIAAAWYETIELLTRLYDAARPGGSPILQVEDDAEEKPLDVCGDVSLGSGLPDPRTSTITNRLIDKIRLIIMTVSENSGLRNRQTRLWIENLCSHTWQQAQAVASNNTANTVDFGDAVDPLASFSNFSNFEDVLEFMGGYEDFQAFDPFISATSVQVDQQLPLPFP